MGKTNKNNEKNNGKNPGKTRDERGRFVKGNEIAKLGGRPKGSLSLVSMLKQKLKEIPKGKKKSYAEMVIDRWLDDAIEKGDANLLKEIVRYIDGMPKQYSDIDVKSDGEPIVPFGLLEAIKKMKGQKDDESS